MTTRCFARCTRTMASGPGRSGRSRSATGMPEALDRRDESSSTKRCATASTCSGLPESSGPRHARRTSGVALFGDLPFVVSGDSADVWARQDEFNPDVVGGRAAGRVQRHRPGLGTSRLQVGRARRARLRLAPAARAAQRRSLRRLSRRSSRRLLSDVRAPARAAARARSCLRCRRSRRRSVSACCASSETPGAEIIAEDLGVIPDFVRESLARLGIPGYRVFRWERHWHDDGPAVSRPGRRIRPHRSPRPAPTIPSRS